MSKTESYNAKEQIRIGRDLVNSYCRENYDAKLTSLVRWHHGMVTPRRLSWRREQLESRIPHLLTRRVWWGDATADEQSEYLALATAYRARAEKEKRVSFSENSFTEVIWHTHDVALFHTQKRDGAICHIRGDAGCGKSTVSTAWHQTNNHGSTIYVNGVGCSGKRTFMERLAIPLGLDRQANWQKLESREIDCFEPGMVLIVDEIHSCVREGTVKQPVIDYIRGIRDLTGASIVSLATDDLFEQALQTSSWKDNQWWRRGARSIDLPKRSPNPGKEIADLFAFRFPDFDLSETLLENLILVNDHPKGGFGQISMIFINAEAEAALKEKPVSVKDINTCTDTRLDEIDAILKRFTGK